MYGVTENYLKAMNAAVHQWYVTGAVTLKDGTVIDLTEDDILQGSLLIQNQCAGDGSIDIGQVYMGEMDMTVIRQDIKKSEWLGAVIKLMFHRREFDGDFAEISPDITAADSYGTIHASHEKEGYEAWRAFESSGSTYWDAGAESATLEWNFPCLTRIRHISLNNLPGTYYQGLEASDGGTLADSDGNMLMAVRTSGFDVSKTVSVYTDSVKTKLIGTADFRDSGYSFVGFTPEGGYIDTYALYFEFPDSYGDDVGLSGCDVYQEAWNDNFWADIPIGTWNVDNAESSEGGVALTCYDNMLAFEEEYDEDVKSITAFLDSSPYTFLKNMIGYVSSESGITTRFYNSSSATAALINGSSSILFKTVSDTKDWKTWRDVLSSAAAALGGFAAANRYGRIEIRNYRDDPVDAITADTFLHEGSTFSDSEKDVRRVNAALDDSTRLKVKNSNWGTGIKSYTLDLGTNPFIAVKSKEDATVIVTNISNGLQPVKFSAFSIERAADPVYDLGDRVSISGGGAKDTFSYHITKFSFDSHKYHMEGVTPIKLGSSSSGGTSSSKSSGSYLKTNGSNMSKAFTASPASFRVGGNICFPNVYDRTIDTDP